MSIHVNIVTPEALTFSGPAESIYVPGWDGEFGAMPEHDRHVALLHAGRLLLQTSSGETAYVVGRGFAEVGPDQVTVLTDSCELATEVDKEQAAKDLAEAQASLNDINIWDPSSRPVIAQLELAQARVDA